MMWLTAHVKSRVIQLGACEGPVEWEPGRLAA